MPDDFERPPIATSALSVLLPVHDVQPRLAEIVRGWTAYLDGLKRDYEIILIDDGSSDGTAKEADMLTEQQPKLKILRHPQRRGFGAALRTGRDKARYPLLCYASCDPAYRPELLGRLLEHIDSVDMMSGYRAGRPVPRLWRIVGFGWRWFWRIVVGMPMAPLPGWLGGKAMAYQKLVRVLFGVRILDIDCPFKLFRREVFNRIPLQSDGVFVHAEILAKANFLSCLMDETPLDVPAEWEVDARRFAELRRVFRRPDFGTGKARPQAEGAI